MPLQIRRGLETERTQLTPTNGLVEGELLYTNGTDGPKLYVGTGRSGEHQGVIITGYSDTNAKDAAAAIFADGTHTGIAFTYDSEEKSLSATIDLGSYNGAIVGNLVGSVFSFNEPEAILLVDSENRIFYGTLVGSLLSNDEDATMLVDADNNLFNGTLVGSLLSTDEDATILVDANNNAFNGTLNGSVFANDSITMLVDSTSGLIVGDISAKLGGNLDLNDFAITGSGNIDILGDISANKVTINGVIADYSEDFRSFTFAPNDSGNGTTNIEFQCADRENTVRFIRYSHTGEFTNKIFAITNGLFTAGDYYQVSRGSAIEPIGSDPELRTSVQDGDSLALSVTTGFDGADYIPTTLIRHFVLGSVSEGVVPGAIQIATISANDLSDANGIVVDSRGFVAVNKGTTAPTSELDVAGTIKASVSLIPGVHADAAARDAAIPTPAAGMMIFVSDIATFQGFNGTAWINLN
jgi:hypothetical protein